MTIRFGRGGFMRFGLPRRGPPFDRAAARQAALVADYPGLAADTMDALREAWAACQAGEDPDAEARLEEAAAVLQRDGVLFGYPLVTATAASLCLVVARGHLRAPAAWPGIAAHLAALQIILGARLSGDGGEAGSRLMAGLHDRVAEAVAALRAGPSSG